jgi:hypothetical protein
MPTCTNAGNGLKIPEKSASFTGHGENAFAAFFF